MKWVGQHIWDFVSRFRNDVYLEDISTGTIASGGNLGLDANNKIVKADTEAGELAFNGSTTNGVLTYGGASTIDVESYLTFANSSNISRMEFLSNQDTGDKFQISTTTNGDTTLATFDDDAAAADLTFTVDGKITMTPADLGTATVFHLDANANVGNTVEIDAGILDIDAERLDVDVNADTIITYDTIDLQGNGILIESTMAGQPELRLKTTNTSTSNSPALTFEKNATDTEDNEFLGQIFFKGEDEGDNLTNFGYIFSMINESDETDEAGILGISTAASDGTTTNLRNIIEGIGHKTSNYVDVNLGYGASSTTTIAGTLTMGSTAFADNSGVIQVATQGTIDHDSLANFVAAEHYRWDTDISGTATIHTNNITDLHGAGVDGSANQLLTDDGDGTVTSESGLTWDGDALDVTSSTSGRPEVNFTNTNSNAKAPTLTFINDKGAAGALNDQAGTITFKSDNASQTSTRYGSMASTVIGVTAGDEAGIMKISTASSDGSSSNLRNVVTGTGSVSADDVDVEIGYGTTSITTIAGTAVVDGAHMQISGSSAQAGQISLAEDTDNGGNRTAIVGAAAMASNRVITLPDATGTVALTNKHIVVIRAAFHASSTSGYYLTIGGGSTNESSTLASFSFTNVFNCPYDGQVLRAAASTQSTGSKTVKLEMYINKDDSDLVADQRGSDWNVSSYTNSWCEDSPGDWTFSKGENIAIRATDSAAVYGTQYTVVLEFDLTT